jgi:hypothetical protein
MLVSTENVRRKPVKLCYDLCSSGKCLRGSPPDPLKELLPELFPHQVEELNRLGKFQQLYKSSPSSRRGNTRLLWIGLIFFAVMLCIIVSIPFREPPKGVPPMPVPLALFFVAFLLLFIVLCGWRLLQIDQGSRVRILVFSGGMARFDGVALVACRWDEIESVQGLIKRYQMHGGTVGARFIIDIIFRENTKMRIDAAKDHLAGMDALFQRLSVESARCLFPRYYAAIEAGETLTFGVLGISKRGIHWGKYTLPWNDPEKVNFRDGLRIRNPHGLLFHPWVRLMDFAIPNHMSFLCLAEHYIRGNERGSTPQWSAILGLGIDKPD